MTTEPFSLAELLAEVRACTVCTEHLPLGPRPVLVADEAARVAIISQAPGAKVHQSGVPWDDRSGDHLREWLAIDRDAFYASDRIAILPIGFCYPGRRGGGDAPPRPECAPLWQARLLDRLPRLELTLLVGRYAQSFHLGRRRRRNLTETVRAFRDYLPRELPLPHPSWRSRFWIREHSHPVNNTAIYKGSYKPFGILNSF